MSLVSCLRTAGLVLILLLSAYRTSSAASEATCIRDWISAKADGSSTAGIAPDDVETLVTNIGSAIGLSSKLNIVPCTYATKAEAFVPAANTKGVPDGEYIIYDPDWVQNVIGKDQTQAIMIFGHELGHLVGRHLTTFYNESKHQKELEADGFSGCALARLGGDWDRFVEVLKRIRSEGPVTDDDYPNQQESIDVAQERFAACGGKLPTASTSAFPAYDGPPLDVSVGELKRYPSGQWIKTAGGGKAFSYDTVFAGLPAKLLFFVSSGTETIYAVRFQFAKSWRRESDTGASWDRQSGNADSDEVSELCGAGTLNKFIEVLKPVASIIDRPVKTGDDTTAKMRTDWCGGTSFCEKLAYKNKVMVYFESDYDLVLQADFDFARIYGRGIPSDSGFSHGYTSKSCKWKLTVSNPSGKKASK